MINDRILVLWNIDSRGLFLLHYVTILVAYMYDIIVLGGSGLCPQSIVVLAVLRWRGMLLFVQNAG